MNTKILVVDDEPDIRFLLKDILEDEGYLVEVAEHAMQANERKSAFSPDLILLDIWMPEIDGVTLLKQWHEKKSLNCPVVMMSGHGTVETAVEATRYGAFDFVEKPLSTAKLLRTVKSALASQEMLATVEEELELPIGNSHVMQNLRQTMLTLSKDKKTVFMSGDQSLDRKIWANYLFNLQESFAPISFELADSQSFLSGLTHNLYISEVTELNHAQQRILLALIKNQQKVPSAGRLIVASGYTFESLQSNLEVLPELIEYWKNALIIPDLNDRIEDIPELVEYFVTWFSDKENLPYRHFGVAAQNLIRNHQWRGGLPELKMVIRQILLLSDEDSVELEEIRQFLESASNLSNQSEIQHSESENILHLSINLDHDLREAREYFEHEYLKKQLELCRYNVSELARKIGQERTNLYRKLKALGLQSKK